MTGPRPSQAPDGGPVEAIGRPASAPLRRNPYVFRYAPGVRAERVLSAGELRAGLAATLDDVQTSGPVFVGAHRKPKAVLMSITEYDALTEAARRQHAVTEAIASVRAEGLELDQEDLALLGRFAAGELEFDEALGRALTRHRR
jgi:prevent-host-death family protein